MRGLRLAKNTISSLIFQITSIICGFILPRLILKNYGSDTNGIVNSITQFLGIISFLELGVGSVVQSSLYRPLAQKDDKKISEILQSANKFFRTLARILLVYVIGLIIVFPFIINKKYDFFFTGTLLFAISISSFAQYYFGIVDRTLLNADQRGYVQFNAQTVTLILNTIASVILIQNGFSIQVLKLTTSIIFLCRPIYLRWYINRHYNIDRKIVYEGEPIKQKWNGFAQHLSAVVLDGTDNIVLTMFSELSNVSIYSVHFMVVNNIKHLFMTATNGVQSLIGELWAKQEIERLNEFFGWVEWVIHTGVVIIFGCTMILIVPFVSVYTAGIDDANYIVPVFATLITLANALHCLRLPYNVMILAAGHYKQTQNNFIAATILNIVVSVVTVKMYGLIGVALGTISAMGFQTIWMAWYDSKNLIKWPITNFLKQLAVDAVSVLICYFACKGLSMASISYLSWVILAFKVFVIVLSIVIVINSIVYNEKMKRLLQSLKKLPGKFKKSK